MKKVVLLLFILFQGVNIQAQKLDSIVYILPDSVEIMLDKYITDIKKNKPDVLFYLYLNMFNGDYRINITEITQDDNLIENTNRFVLIDTNKYPVILDYDLRFGLLNRNEKIGKLGRRFNGYIRSRTIIMEGYSLTFNGFGENIKESWGIYKKK